MSPCLQVRPQLDVIEDFAIENDPQRLILILNRLTTPAQINDAEPRIPESDFLIQQNSKLVRAPMPQHRQHLAQITLSDVLRRGTIKHAGDPTHGYFKSSLLTFPEPVF